jgi:DNA-binding transcriptional regulator YdaS (Cro superfamily)
MSQANHIDRAIKIMGGLKAAQVALGLNTYQALQQWRTSRVPAERCPEIEKATNGAVRCEDLRPDVDWAYLRATDCPVVNVGAGETAQAAHDANVLAAMAPAKSLDLSRVAKEGV